MGYLPESPGTGSGMAAQSHFEPTSDSVTAARHSIRGTLGGLPDGVVERVELIVSELATNAVRHARTPYDLTVQTGSVVRIAVRDGSPVPPSIQHPDPTAIGGRGLLLVDHFSDRWGSELIPGGKVVWAEVQATGPIPADGLSELGLR
jgi:anti-sigma regulatory factor (Ser/Thr protein kinase)